MLTSATTLPLALIVAESYALGCIVAGYYVARVVDGRDIRMLGSGNAGTRNVARLYGRKAARATLLIDAGKAAVAVAVATRIADVPWAAALALLLVIVGHVWPLQLDLRGGKGAAPAAGGLLMADPIAALIALGAGGLLYAITRRFTPSGLGAVAAAPVAALILRRPAGSVILMALAALLVLAVHHPRIDARRTSRLTTDLS